MKRCICFLTLAVLTALFAAPCHADISLKKAVVKIYTVYNAYSYHNPWQTKGQKTFHGSGCIIGDNRILTNAHVVSDQMFIQVRRAGDAKRYSARVEVVAHECDLAILRLEEEEEEAEFFAGVKPIPLGSLAGIRDKVAVYGFPDGGDKLSITEGIVSRVEHVNYAHSKAYLLACQIDAPINSGNSGGPVIKDNEIVGVAFQGMAGQRYENIGYMVPAPVIRHFLTDIGDGSYDGTPSLGISMQKMENPAMRRHYRMEREDTGALVNTIYPDSPAEGVLRRGDIILSIDGIKVENDGTIEFREGERTYFGYLFQKKFIGDPVELEILREGGKMEVTIRLSKPVDFDRLVPHMQHDVAPTYFIFGGLVFEPLTLNYLREFGSDSDWYLYAPTALMHEYLNGEPTRERRQVVVLTEVLADSSNVGFQEFGDNIIETVNGRKISTIRDVMEAIDGHGQDYHVINDVRGFTISLDDRTARQSTERILRKYHISADRSADLKGDELD